MANIYKIAQGIPEGKSEITVVMKDGEFQVRVTGHGGKTSCLTGDDKELTDLISNAMGEVDKEGKTPEYYRDLQRGRPQAIRTRPATAPDEPLIDEPQRGRARTEEMTGGYGV